MKSHIKSIFSLLLLLGSLLCTQVIFAQAPPPPPSEKGTGSNKAPGGGAPIDGGLLIALASVAGYGAWRLRRRKA